MTRKHFVAVAKSFSDNLDNPDVKASAVATYAVKMMAREVATVFAECNPRFQRGRFLAACGVE